MNYRPVYPNELYHYGIKRQRWGVRRFQNPDGTLTAAGKRRYGTLEIHDDVKKAYELGRKGTIEANAAYKATVKAQKSADRYAKKPTEKRLAKKDLDESVANRLNEMYKNTKNEAQNHVQQLRQKYGDANIKDINYDKKGRMAEAVATDQEYILSSAASIGLTAASVALAATGALPFYAIVSVGPKSGKQLGNDLYSEVRAEEKRKADKSN